MGERERPAHPTNNSPLPSGPQMPLLRAAGLSRHHPDHFRVEGPHSLVPHEPGKAFGAEPADCVPAVIVQDLYAELTPLPDGQHYHLAHLLVHRVLLLLCRRPPPVLTIVCHMPCMSRAN